MGEHYLEFRLRKWVEIQRKDLAVRVYRDDKLFGTLKVSQGSIDWSPAGSKKENPHVIHWNGI